MPESVSKPTKQNGGQVGDHSSIRDSWPIAVSGYPRGPRVGCETTCPRHTLRLTNRLRLALEPECLENRTATARENTQRWSGLDQRHSSCLWFQIFGVEAHSSLPHDQNNSGNFPRQGQPCHLWPHAFGHECRIELCQRAALDRSHYRRLLEQVLQIVIAVLIQPANLCMLLLPSQLVFRYLTVGAGTGHHTQTAIGPQLPLGTKPVRGLTV